MSLFCCAERNLTWHEKDKKEKTKTESFSVQEKDSVQTELMNIVGLTKQVSVAEFMPKHWRNFERKKKKSKETKVME